MNILKMKKRKINVRRLSSWFVIFATLSQGLLANDNPLVDAGKVDELTGSFVGLFQIILTRGGGIAFLITLVWAIIAFGRNQSDQMKIAIFSCIISGLIGLLGLNAQNVVGMFS